MRVGIIGCGGIAHHHLRGYRAAGVAVELVYDALPASADAFGKSAEIKVARSMDEMLAAGLDAVSICTPPGTHLACCEPFLQRKIAVLCEKPLEANLAASVRLAEIVRDTGAVFMTGFCHRFHGPILEIKRLLDAGTLGRPVLFRNIFSGWVPLAGNHRMSPQLSGGGVLADNGAHAVDLFRFLVGECSAVTATTTNLVQDLPVEDYCAVHLACEQPHRAAGEIVSSYSLRVGANQVELFCTEATAMVTYGMKHLPECAYKPHGADDWIAVDCASHPQRFVAEVSHFLECVRSPGSVPRTSVTDGLRAAEVIAAAYRSASEGNRIVLTSAKD